jgi:ABC-type sugar transport system ATPase subunit
MDNSLCLPQPMVQMRGICKSFGPVQVLFDVDVDFYAGETHILAGENGAGKSTLVRILAGNYPDYSGTIRMCGKQIRPTRPQEAAAHGIAIIYQELSLVPTLSVQENLFLGHLPVRGFGFVDMRRMRQEAERLLADLGLEIDVSRPVGEYPIAIQQMVEIAKAFSRQASVIIMDEPTSALSVAEAERLFQVVERLTKLGRAVVYITHRLEEMERLGDRFTVLRDGRVVGRALRGQVSPSTIVSWMVGRQWDQQFPQRKSPGLSERLRVEGLTVRRGGVGGKPAVKELSFSVRAGEVLGLAGLQGSGATWVLRGIYDPKGSNSSARIFLDGKPVHFRQPAEALHQGVAFVPSDRKAMGLVLSMSVLANATMSSWDKLSRWGFRRPRDELSLTTRLAGLLRLRAPSVHAEVGHLSGGNQQKVVIAKGAAVMPRVFLLDEPTRGIDVGAKHDIYDLITQWTEQGVAIILTTSELPELLALSHRILVLHRGEKVAEFPAEEATPDRVLAAAMGVRV